MTRKEVVERTLALGATCPYCLKKVEPNEIRFGVNPEGTEVPIGSGKECVDVYCGYCWHTSDLASSLTKPNQLLLSGPGLTDTRHVEMLRPFNLVGKRSLDGNVWVLEKTEAES